MIHLTIVMHYLKQLFMIILPFVLKSPSVTSESKDMSPALLQALQHPWSRMFVASISVVPSSSWLMIYVHCCICCLYPSICHVIWWAVIPYCVCPGLIYPSLQSSTCFTRSCLCWPTADYQPDSINKGSAKAQWNPVTITWIMLTAQAFSSAL